MQILTSKEVEYCYVTVDRLVKSLYLSGLYFQNKLYVKEQVFAYSEKQKAIHCCEAMYLANKGNKSCLLLEEASEFTVWIEDKSARIIGSKSPELIIEELRLENIEIDFCAQELEQDSAISLKLIKTFETSWQRVINLGRELITKK